MNMKQGTFFPRIYNKYRVGFEKNTSWWWTKKIMLSNCWRRNTIATWWYASIAAMAWGWHHWHWWWWRGEGSSGRQLLHAVQREEVLRGSLAFLFTFLGSLSSEIEVDKFYIYAEVVIFEALYWRLRTAKSTDINRTKKRVCKQFGLELFTWIWNLFLFSISS